MHLIIFWKLSSINRPTYFNCRSTGLNIYIDILIKERGLKSQQNPCEWKMSQQNLFSHPARRALTSDRSVNSFLTFLLSSVWIFFLNHNFNKKFVINNQYETISGPVRSECSSCKMRQGSCWVDILNIKPFHKLFFGYFKGPSPWLFHSNERTSFVGFEHC